MDMPLYFRYRTKYRLDILMNFALEPKNGWVDKFAVSNRHFQVANTPDHSVVSSKNILVQPQKRRTQEDR